MEVRANNYWQIQDSSLFTVTSSLVFLLLACRRSTVSRSNFCGEHRLIDGDSDEKNKPGQTGQAEDVRKKGNIIGTDKSSQDLPRASTKPRFTATELTVPPLNTSLEDFRNAEDLRPPLLFTIDESDMMSCDTSDDEDACDK